jgi:Tryptophan-associated transmembrane protein (Trp_oprn_chp)
VTVVSAPPERSPRTLGVVCVSLAASAALMWGASAVTWEGSRTGAQAAPSLTGVALLALAGVAGVLATGGFARRLVAGLLAAAGAVQVVAAAVVLGGGGGILGPLLAVAGGAVLLAGAVLAVLRERRLPRLGARYAAAGDKRAQRDPDRAAWEALDAGEDPTSEPVLGADEGTGDGGREGRG